MAPEQKPLGLNDLPVPHAGLVNYIAQHPEKSMVEIIEPYRKYESQLRGVFAQDRENPVLDDPYVNCLPLFTDDTKNVKTRARNLAAESQEEKDRYIMPLPDNKRRPHGSPAVVQSLQEFRKNFNIFSELSLAEMDWSNVIAAGSSVVNCVLPTPDEFNVSKRTLRDYYHNHFCPASDVDLFLYGLDHEQAIEKIKHIEKAVRDAVLSEVTVVRTKHAITIATQYPIRHIQIVLRLYKSPSEVVTGIDIDAATSLYDGSQVWVTPRALQSFITQANHIDLTRRSPSYENRLSKYSHRNFEVYWSSLDRTRINPTIFERSFKRTLGLARLLVLERLPTSQAREQYLGQRREERGRPPLRRNRQNVLMGNIKDDHEDEVAEWADEEDVSNYHTFSVPYGQKYQAKRIEKLCYTRDLLLNAEWNQPKDREVYLHRHPAFFGRIEDVIEDCCGACPEPVTPEEIEIAEKESKRYISGKVSFLVDDPGRQEIGSFHPLTDDDWTDMAYISDSARLYQSIVDKKVEEVRAWLAQEGADPNLRDHTGRTPLHLAVISSTPEVVRCLVDHGARLTARLAEGTTALHLAAERGNAEMVKILMEKSISNEEEEEEKNDRRRKARGIGAGDDASRSGTPGSEDEDADPRDDKNDENANGEEEEEEEEDDYEDDEEDDDDGDDDGELVDDKQTDFELQSMATGSFVNVKHKRDGNQDDPELNQAEDEPDFYQSDVVAWDIPSSPLHLAISEGHEEVVTLLCNYGADVLLPVKYLSSDRQPESAILTLILASRLPIEKARSMAMLLLRLGVVSSQADLNGCTAFHQYIETRKGELINTLCEHDALGLKTSINHLSVGSDYYSNAVGPLHTALENADSATALKLLDLGAKAEIDFEIWLKSATSGRAGRRLKDFEANKALMARTLEQPLILAVKYCPDARVALKLLEMGANPNTATRSGQELIHAGKFVEYNNEGRTVLDIVRVQLSRLRRFQDEPLWSSKPELPHGMYEHLRSLAPGSYKHWITSQNVKHEEDVFKALEKKLAEDKKCGDLTKGAEEKAAFIKNVIAGLEKIEHALVRNGGETFDRKYPHLKSTTPKSNRYWVSDDYDMDSDEERANQQKKEKNLYGFKIGFRNVTDVTESREKAYLDLFEAAWSGDLDTIKSYTLQAWGDGKKEPPLKIAVSDKTWNSPFSLAFLRGHYDVARGILAIAKLQYCPIDKTDTRYEMDVDELHSILGSECYDSDYDSDSNESRDSDQPPIVSKKVDGTFTIDTIGKVSMQVKSTVRPLSILHEQVLCFKSAGDKADRKSLFSFVIETDDAVGLRTLLDFAALYSGQKLPGDDEDEPNRLFSLPDTVFRDAIKHGRTAMLSEIIKRTGAGIPLDNIVKKSGVAVDEKPRYYQGLTVYGTKRKDWATAGRNAVTKSTGLQKSPLLYAALDGSIESVEWFFSDTPARCYIEYGKSSAGGDDPRLKHLSRAPGGFDKVVTKWLGVQNELVLHCAVMSRAGVKTKQLVEYLVRSYPESLEYKSANGRTPLWVAFHMGRTDLAQVLLEAGADETVQDNQGWNILHAAVWWLPEADQLKPLLELVRAEVRSRLMSRRNSLYPKRDGADSFQRVSYRYGNSLRKDFEHCGVTPLHLWVERFCVCDSEFSRPGAPKKTPEEKVKAGLAVLDLLLGYCEGPEVEMLNGVGDTPLHTAVMNTNAHIVKALLAFRSQVLYRENTIGRTPAESARVLMTQMKFKAPPPVNSSFYMYGSRNRPRALGRLGEHPVADFIDDKETAGMAQEALGFRQGQLTNRWADGETIRKGREMPKRCQAVWDTVTESMAREGSVRKLVSLAEANDVAKRLGDRYQAQRYVNAVPKLGEEEKKKEEQDESEKDFADEMVLMLSGKTAWQREGEDVVL